MAHGALPTGTVTFLFTDIEGSTRLVQELGSGYADVLHEHRRLLRGACERHDGVEVDTQGDAFFFGKHYIGARITLLVAGAHIRVVDDNGALICELTIDPTRDYQALGTPPGRPKIGHYVPRQVGTIT